MKPLIPTNEVIGTFASEDTARQAMVVLIQGMNNQDNVLRQAAAEVNLKGAQVTVSWNNKATLKPIIADILRNLGADVPRVIERNCD